MRGKITVAAVALLAALGLACGSGGKAEPGGAPPGSATNQGQAAAAPVVKLGQTITYKSNVLGTKTEATYVLAGRKEYTTSPDGLFRPESGAYLTFTLSVASKTGQVEVSPSIVRFLAKDGTVYNAAFAIGFSDALDFITLNPGQKKAGRVVFDLPKAAIAGGKVELMPSALDNKGAGYWTL